MTTEIKGSRNYSATVIRVPKVRKAENSDRLYIVDALGMTAIVDDSWIAREGELALIFPAEVQLSESFTGKNNLYRDNLQNEDQSKAGYIERSRRVRALKLRGNISNGLVLPAHSLYHIDKDGSYNDLREGDVFDTYRGVEICRKYEVPIKPGANRADKKLKKAFKRVEDKYLPQHFETGQWLREQHNVQIYEELIITQKLHGTSCRIANTIVKRELKWYERLAQKLGIKVAEHEYDLVGGSKKVIKDPNNPNQKHHYKFDIWSDALKMYGDRLPKNIVVYGELVGYVPGGGPIQKGHTYDEVPDDYHLYVYRVAVVTEDGGLYDLGWDAVRDFCERHGFDHVPELDRMPKVAFDIEAYNEKNFWEEQQLGRQKNADPYIDTVVKLSHRGTGKDEGIAIRVERGLTPEIYKYKNKSHYLYESAQLDTGEADLESVG